MTTAAVLSPSPVQRFYDNNGNPLAGGTVATYAAGTTTPIATYADYTATTPNANPIVLNFRGEASIWLLPNVAYKYVVSDSSNNVISTTDQITVSQLLTLFGGVDTGVANAYILNFNASFSSLTNGVVVYWVPGNTNTTSSTLNVNGLGVYPILNLNGTAITANQIPSGIIVQTVFYNGNWILIAGATQTFGVTIGTFGPEATVVSSGTTDLGTATGHVAKVTGTTTITSFGTSAQVSAPIYLVRFTGALTLTYNASSLILPYAASITTAAGDSLIAEYLGSGNWQVLSYQTATLPVIGSFTATLTGMSGTTTGTVNYMISNKANTPGTAGTSTQYVTLYTGASITGTSNTNALTLTGLPAAITPGINFTVLTLVENNTATNIFATALVSTSNTIQFSMFNAGGSGFSATGFTTSGTKGLGSDWTITYPL